MKTVVDATKMMRRMNFHISPRNVDEKNDSSVKVVENRIAVIDDSSSASESEADEPKKFGMTLEK